jgi:hypothetical protein
MPIEVALRGASVHSEISARSDRESLVRYATSSPRRSAATYTFGCDILRVKEVGGHRLAVTLLPSLFARTCSSGEAAAPGLMSLGASYVITPVM